MVSFSRLCQYAESSWWSRWAYKTKKKVLVDNNISAGVKSVFLRGGQSGTGTAQDWAFCSKAKPCGVGQGDCDSDEQCQSGLKCAIDNCKSIHPNAHRLADCCIGNIIKHFDRQDFYQSKKNVNTWLGQLDFHSISNFPQAKMCEL